MCIRDRHARHLRLGGEERRHRRDAADHGRHQRGRSRRHHHRPERWRARRHRGLRRPARRRPRHRDAPARRRRARQAGGLVNLSRPFIERPVATTLLMAALLIAGLLAYERLPVSALPQVDYPTIRVVTFYPGGSPDVMASSVTAPLERQFGQMPGLAQMTSNSSDGSSVITLQFGLDLSLDVAEQEVQQSINAAFTYLPADLPIPPIYSKVNPADAPILTLALSSDTLPLPRVEDLADTRLAQKIAEVPGVGLVSVSGGQRPAVRVRVNPTALAAYGRTSAPPSPPRASTARRAASTARPARTRSAPTTSSNRARTIGPSSSRTG